MRIKKIIMSISFLLLGIGNLYAQETTTATGGEATGTGGTASYSIGQLVYTTNTGTNGSILQGVQQAFEISVTEVNESSINYGLSVYPNPANDYLTLKVKDNELSILNFQLYNIQGKLLRSEHIENKTTTIKMENLSKSTYFLKVTNNQTLIKTFKIIKN